MSPEGLMRCLRCRLQQSPANSGSGDSFDSNPAANEPDQEPSPPQDHPVEEIGNGSVMDLDQDFDQTHFLSSKNYTLDSGVNDVFNFQAQHVTQDFDNIMSAENFEGQPIIYPVYSIHNSAGISRDLSSTPANSSFRPTRDIFFLCKRFRIRYYGARYL